MDDGGKILIDLAGQQFRIAPPRGDAERLRKAAAYVGQKVEAISQAGVVSTQRTALLAALELALEVFDQRDAKSGLTEGEIAEARKRLERVIGRIDEVLSKNP